MKNIALIYDFDKTLTHKNMQEFSLFEELGIKDSEFWGKTRDLADELHMDNVHAYMYQTVIEFSKQSNKKLTREWLNNQGRDIEFFPGVLGWFKRQNNYGKKLGVNIEHYIVSSGLKEIIEGTKIAKEFKKIFASEFHYNEEGIADWPLISINYTGKTQYLFRINKQILDVNDDDGINKYMPKYQRPVPFENMIYIGDGYSDVPCMKLIKEYKGNSIAVVNKEKEKIAKDLLEAKRVDYVFDPDFNKGSELDLAVQSIIEYLARKSEIIWKD